MVRCGRLDDISERRNRQIILYLKVAICLLGVIILGLGYHAFFKSSWTNEVDMENILPGSPTIKAYHMCQEENWNYIKQTYWNDDWSVSCGRYGSQECQGNCPKTSSEIFFLSVVTTWFVLSFVNLAIFLFVDKIWRISVQYFVELTYNFITFLAIMLGGIFLMASASRIDRVVEKLITEVGRKDGVVPSFLTERGDFLSTQKYWAGGLTLVQASLHLVLNVNVALLRKYIIQNSS